MKETKEKRLPLWRRKGTLQSVLFQFSIYVIPLTLFLIFWFGTNINSLIMAFQNISIKGERSFAGFSHFKEFIEGLFGQSNNTLLATSFINSIKMFTINLVICMPLYLLFSLYLFKKMPMGRVFVILVMIPSIISDFVFAIIFKQIVNVVLPDLFGGMGVKNFPILLEDADYTFGTMLFYMIWLSFSTSLIIYPNAMRAIPEEVLESARIDGAGLWKEFFHIILPLIYPTISSFLIMGVAGIFVNAGPAVAFFKYGAYPETYTVGYYYIAQVMNAVNETGYPELAAGGIILTIISCPLTFGVKYVLEKCSPEVN